MYVYRPPAHRRARQVDPDAFEYLLKSIKRQCVAEFAREYIRKKTRRSYALRYYLRRQGSRLNRPAVILALHALASLARIFTPYMPLHRELRRLYGQFLRYLVAYMLKLASAGAYLFIVGDVVNNINVR